MAFGRNRQGPSENTPESEPSGLVDCGDYEEGDPRYLFHQFLRGCGLTIVIQHPGTSGDLVRQVLPVVPHLARSTPARLGFHHFDHGSDLVWAVVENSYGSALVIFALPDADSMFLVQEVTDPLQQSGLKPHFVMSGEAVLSLHPVLTDTDIAASQDLPGLRFEADTTATLSATLRRAAQHWERRKLDLYARDMTDADGDEVTVLLGLDDGHPVVVSTFSVPAQLDLSDLDPIADRGPYEVRRLESDQVMIIRSVGRQVSAQELEECAQTMVDDVAAGLSILRGDGGPAGSDVADLQFAYDTEWHSMPVWHRVATGPGASVPVRRDLAWPEWEVPYTYIERIRDALPESDDPFEPADALGRELHQLRGSGFEYTWRAAGDGLLVPPRLSLHSAVVEPSTGKVAAIGHPTHVGWDMAPAFDLGAITGSNGLSFPAAGHRGGWTWPAAMLYVGSTRSGLLTPLDGSVGAISVDLDRNSGALAVLHQITGSIFAVTHYPEASDRRTITAIDGLAGNEPLRFSPDGAWLLVSRSSSSILIEADTGRWVELDVPNACWWPGADSALLSLGYETGEVIPRVFDLETNAYSQTFPAVTLDHPFLQDMSHVWFPAVSPQSDEILAMAPVGVSQKYRDEHGVGHHLVRISLMTGQGVLVEPAFVNAAGTAERECREARWTGPTPRRTLRLATTLSARLQLPISLTSAGTADADDAEPLLVHSVNRAIALTKEGRDAHHLMPEIITKLPIGHSDRHGVWSRQGSWLEGLRRPIANFIGTGEVSAGAADGWRAFAATIDSLVDGGTPPFDALDVSWGSSTSREASKINVPEPPSRTSDAPSTRSLLETDAPALVLVRGQNIAVSQMAPGTRRLICRFEASRDSGVALSALLCDADRQAISDQHFVFYNQPTSPRGGVVLQTASGARPEIVISLDLLPSESAVERVTLVCSASTGDALRTRAPLGVFICDEDGVERARFVLGREDLSTESAILLADVYLHNREWKVRAIGQGYDNGLAGIATNFGINVG